jgi:glycosyltransferase involved in cell wall biosynthesis
MRILIATYAVRRREGGTSGVALSVGKGLERLGHNVEYIFAGDLPTPSYFRGRFEDLGFAVALANVIKRDPGRFSVVNIHAPGGFLYGLVRHLSPSLRENGPVYVMTLHGLEERRIYAMGREARKGKAFHFNFKNRLWHRIYHMPRFYLSIKTADQAICFGRDVWTVLQLKYNLDPDQVSYIPNGVDEQFFIPRDYPREPSARLLYVGTWLDQRGIFYLRDALRNLAARLPGLRLTIAGCGSDADQIRNFFDPTLRSLVDVISVVPFDQMPALFADHDIFVFPSLLEGTPLAVQEAMAAGMAVVTTETCGMVDLVEHDYNGLLVPPANATAVEDAILRLSQDPELRAQLGQAAQQTMSRFTWARTARGVEAACERALRRVGRTGDFPSGEPVVQPEAAVGAGLRAAR